MPIVIGHCPVLRGIRQCRRSRGVNPAGVIIRRSDGGDFTKNGFAIILCIVDRTADNIEDVVEYLLVFIEVIVHAASVCNLRIEAVVAVA